MRYQDNPDKALGQSLIIGVATVVAALFLTVMVLVDFGFSQNRIPPAPDAQDQTLQFFFKGAWLPSIDPAEIGPENYSELKNLRYGPDDIGLEGVQGYSKINTTAITTYTSLRSGFQLLTPLTVNC